MADLTLSALFEAVYQIATDDPVVGGLNGVSNRQAQSLGNRTEWLKQKIDQSGLNNLTEFNGDLSTLKQTGFYFVEQAATNKPTTTSGYCIVIGSDSITALGNVSGYHHVFMTASGRIYNRSYQNNAPSPLDPSWKLVALQSDFVSFRDSFIGSIQMSGSQNTPTGWLYCDGSAVSRSTYANLFSKIGTSYGSGNGSTTFNLPDLRGEFVRGFDNGRGVDPSRIFGEAQDGNIVTDHAHSMTEKVVQSGTGATVLDASFSTANATTGGMVLSNSSQNTVRNQTVNYYIKF